MSKEISASETGNKKTGQVRPCPIWFRHIFQQMHAAHLQKQTFQVISILLHLVYIPVWTAPLDFLHLLQ